MSDTFPLNQRQRDFLRAWEYEGFEIAFEKFQVSLLELLGWGSDPFFKARADEIRAKQEPPIDPLTPPLTCKEQKALFMQLFGTEESQQDMKE